MYISEESPAQTDERLRRVAAAATIEVHEGGWWYDEFPLDEYPARVRGDTIALVRDEDGWSQLVPVRAEDRPTEQFRIWSSHFPDGLDNSGFVGWLAMRIKARTGSGIFVVCGQNSGRGGIYDYWGCPADAAATVIPEVRALTGAAARVEDSRLAGQPVSLDGVRMRAVATAPDGEVDVDTLHVRSTGRHRVGELRGWGGVDGLPRAPARGRTFSKRSRSSRTESFRGSRPQGGDQGILTLPREGSALYRDAEDSSG